MLFEVAIEKELKSIGAFNNRVYPHVSPEATAKNGIPYCIYVASEGLRDKDLTGYRNGKSVQGEINVVAAKYAEMKTITRAVINLLVTMEQRVIGNDGPFIQEFTYSQPVELYEENPNLYRCLIDFEAYFEL